MRAYNLSSPQGRSTAAWKTFAPWEAAGTKGQYADVSLHAGLVCLDGPLGMDLTLQRELYSEALDELELTGSH